MYYSNKISLLLVNNVKIDSVIEIKLYKIRPVNTKEVIE